MKPENADTVILILMLAFLAVLGAFAWLYWCDTRRIDP